MLGAALVGVMLGIWLAPWLAAGPWPLLGLPLLAGVDSRWRAPALALLLVGPAAWWAQGHAPQRPPHDVSALACRRFCRLVGVVSQPPSGDAHKWHTTLAIARARFPARAATGHLLVTFAAPARPMVGERWAIAGRVARPDGPANPGDFDLASYLADHGVYATMHAETARRLGLARGWAQAHALDVWRMRLVTGLGCGLSRSDAALFGSLIYGNGAAPVDAATANAFRTVGLAHLLAASGLQLTLLAGLLYAAARKLRAPSWFAALLALPAVLAYCAVTGAPPSMLRATVMALMALGGQALGRRGAPGASLYVSAIALLIAFPRDLFDIGWQFSYLATYALMRLGAWLAKHRLPLPEHLTGLLLVPVTAWLWVTPLQVARFGTWSAVALPVNWLADPIVGLLTPWGLAVSVLGAAWPQSAAFANRLTALALWALTALVNAFAAMPASNLTAPAIGAVCLASVYGALWCGLRRPRLAIACALVALLAFPHPSAAQRLELSFLSVGQGDGIAIRTPHGHWIEIDGGPADRDYDAGAAEVLPYLRREGCRRLDLMVATHAHRDHIGGLPALLSALPTAAAWDAGQPSRTEVNDDLLASWLRHHVPFVQVHPGVRRSIDGVGLEVLSAGRDLRDLNNGSVVVMLTYVRFRALLTGDMQEAAERQVLATRRDLRADVLKVAHHGSRTGTTDAWLARVRPRFAVISVGAHNRFGHPHAETLRRLRRFHVPYRRTDQDGAVLVRSDGRTWQECDRRSDWTAWQTPK